MRAFTGIIAAALIVAACGGDAIEPDEPAPVVADATSTTVVERTTTSLAPTPTTIVETTTTTSAVPTTTAPVEASSAYQALMARVAAAGTPTSMRVEGSIAIAGAAGVEGELTLPFAMAYDEETGDSSFLMDLSDLGAAADDDETTSGMGGMFGEMFGEMEMRTIDGTAYLRFGFFNAFLGAETEWVSMPAEDGADFTADMQSGPVDPNEMLDGYADADAEVEELGRETVNGVETDHYRITIDTAAYLEELSEEERAELEASGPVPVGELPMDLWVSDEGHLIRMLVEIDGSAVVATSPEDRFERMTMTFDVFDIDQRVSIKPPPADQVTSLDDLEAAFVSGG